MIYDLKQIEMIEKLCTLQWISAVIRIKLNEKSPHTKRCQLLCQYLCHIWIVCVYVKDSKESLRRHGRSICDLNVDRKAIITVTTQNGDISKTLELREMESKILVYNDVQLTPQHIFTNPVIASQLFKRDLKSYLNFYTRKALELAEFQITQPNMITSMDITTTTTTT